MLARAITFALVGLEPRRVEIEAHVQGGTPSLTIVGLADRAIQEAKQRVRSGIRSAELQWPDGRTDLRLVERGRELAFGRFLNDDERRGLARELRGALLQARGGARI